MRLAGLPRNEALALDIVYEGATSPASYSVMSFVYYVYPPPEPGKLLMSFLLVGSPIPLQRSLR
jgi:hypothetical protein